MRDAADAGGGPRRYRVVEADRIEVDREKTFLHLLSNAPDYAARWLKDLNRVIAELPEFPGPHRREAAWRRQQEAKKNRKKKAAPKPSREAA